MTSNEIEGSIRARDIGDSRLTSYYYAFDGGQGDIFVNVVTNNFSGDIDIFTVEGLRPLTKMVIYADSGSSETGRLIYLRKPERLILRIEGRSPNDDPATFRIKFGGSFVALSSQKPQEAPSIKGSEVNTDAGVRVNSVGTIVAVIPKPQPTPKAMPQAKEKVAVIDKSKKSEPANKPSPKPTEPKKEPKETTAAAKKPPPSKPKSPMKTPPAKETAKVEKKNTATPANPPKKSSGPEVKTIFGKTKPKKVEIAKKEPEKTAKPIDPPKASKPDPMASIRLIVLLKDGSVIESPMSDVDKFTVDDGVLTVRAKNGTSVKYSMLDVAKVTIE